MLRGIADGVAPGMTIAVSSGESDPEIWTVGRTGTSASDRLVDEDTKFDLASLTKPLTTTLWCLRLVESGVLDLNAAIGRYVDVHDRELAEVPVWRLLNHTSGLPAHRAYYRGLGPYTVQSGNFPMARQSIRRLVLRSSLEAKPGERETYSDIGYFLLEAVCEGVDVPLASRWSSLPGHGTGGLHFRPQPSPAVERDYAATEECAWRKVLIRGEVHDDNAWTMGGVAGHAGAFGRIGDVWRLARAHLDLWHDRDATLGISSALFRDSVHRRWMHVRGTRVLGWDTPTPGGSTSGRYFTRMSIGHLGFTGCSVWIDLEREVIIVLLTNRICPTRESSAIRGFRPEIHDAGWALAERIRQEQRS